MISSQFLKFIPSSASVYIYGAGASGKKIYSLLKNRGDIRVLGFIDTFKSGTFLDLPILSVTEYNAQNPANDGVIIGSVERYTIQQMKKNLDKISNQFFVPAEMTEGVYSEAELGRLETIKNKLEFGKERFEAVLQARISGDFSALKYDFVTNIHGKISQYSEGAQIGDGDIIIDGGTFDGEEAMSFAKRVGKTGKVFTFDPWGAIHLKNPTAFYAEGNIQSVKSALWSSSCPVYFSSNVGKGGEAGAFVSAVQDGGMEELSGVAIDDFVEKKISHVNFIKMDVEGSELHALEGARITIKKMAPNLAICVYHDSTHFYLIPEMILKFYPRYHLGFGHYSDCLDESVLYFSKDTFKS